MDEQVSPSIPQSSQLSSGAVPPVVPSVPLPNPAASSFPMMCPRCHAPVLPEYYYCPNCGVKLTEAPLSTTAFTQAWIYAFSIILPWIAYLAIGYWPGIKYMRSADERAKQIGIVAMILLIVSSIIAFWLSIVWIQSYVQQSLSDVNNLGL